MVAPLLIVGSATLLLWTGLSRGQDWGDDFAQYIMQARSLVEGRPAEFITVNRFIVENSVYAVGPVTYPWGYPLLLAPVYAAFGLDPIALKIVDAACFLVFLAVIWAGFGRYHTGVWRIALVSLFALNPMLLSFVNSILADLPFLLASTGAVLLTGRLVVDQRRLISPVWDHLLLGAAIAAAFVIRINGVLLVATLAVAQVITLVTCVRRNGSLHRPDARAIYRFCRDPGNMQYLLVSLLPYVTFVVLVVTFRLLLPEGGLSGQKAIFSGISLATIKSNINLYAALPAEFFAGVPHALVLFGATVPLAIAGAAARLRHDYHVITYLGLTILLYLLWPTTGGIRYVFPILPFYLSFVVSSFEQYVGGSGHPERAVRSALCIVPVFLLLTFFAGQSVGHAASNLSRSRAVSSGPFVETSRNLFSYVAHNTKPDAVIVFFKPRLMALMTGRRSVKLFSLSDLPRGDYLCLYRPDEVLDQVLPDEVKCMIGKETIEPVYSNPDFVMYRLLKSHETAWQAIAGCAVQRTSE